MNMILQIMIVLILLLTVINSILLSNVKEFCQLMVSTLKELVSIIEVVDEDDE